MKDRKIIIGLVDDLSLIAIVIVASLTMAFLLSLIPPHNLQFYPIGGNGEHVNETVLEWCETLGYDVHSDGEYFYCDKQYHACVLKDIDDRCWLQNPFREVSS